MKKILAFLLLAVALSSCLTSCTDAQQAKFGGYGQTFKIEVLSGGQVVRTYKSTGKVLSESDSDGYYFTDAATKKLVEVSGDVIITEE